MTTMISIGEVNLHVTRECDNCCEYCYVAPNLEIETVVNSCGPLYGDIETMRQVIHAVRFIAGAKDLVFVGGDPCKHPDFVSLIKFAKAEGLNVCVLSNTHAYKDGGKEVEIECIVDFLDEIDFTLHGASPEVHDAFTKRSGSYERATENIRRFIRARRNEQPVGIVLNMVPDVIKDLPRIMENIASRLQMQPGLDFFTIQRIAPSGKALENFEEWRIDSALIERAFETFENVRVRFGFETKVCIDAFPWCSVSRKHWKYLESLCGGCNWGKPGGVLSALVTGELQRCALCQDTLGVNILDLKTPEEFSDFMLTHPVLRAVGERRHLDAKCRNCGLLEQCGGGCIIATGTSDPYSYKDGLLTVREGHDYLSPHLPRKPR